MRRDRTETENGDRDSTDPGVVARVCWHYFKEGQTQEAIAQRLGFTRKRVNRILNDARSSGFVHITINSPQGPCVELERRLVDASGLRNAVVVPSPAADVDVRSVVGAAAGQYVSDNLAAGGRLGINWGGTINAAAQNLVRRQGSDNTVVMLCGGLGESTQINPYDNAAMFARALDARCHYVTAPMFADSKPLRDALIASEPIRRVIDMVGKLDMALLSAVDLSEESKALEYGVISRDLWTSLREKGAVGDVCGHYLNEAGQIIRHPFAQRAVNPPIDDLRRVPELVLAAGGRQKVPIIRGAIRAGLCHVLITDEATAIELLDAPAAKLQRHVNPSTIVSG